MKTFELNRPLLHPMAYQDEFPTAYLIRLAEVNRYGSYNWIIKNNVSGNIPTTSKFHYRVLCQYEWTGYSLTHDYVKYLAIEKLYFTAQRLKFCPYCIADKPYLKIIWQLKPSAICVQHRIWLQDACDKCNEAFYRNNASITECICGEMYKNNSVIYASQDMVNLQKFIDQDDNANNSHSSIMIIDSILELRKRLELVMFFNRWLRYRNTYEGISTIKKSVDSLTDVGEALFSDIEGFISFLKKLHDASIVAGKNNNLFSRFHQNLYRNFPDECFAPLRNAVEEYINTYWEKPLNRRNINFSEVTINSHPWVPFRAACIEYDLHKSELRTAIRNHLIRVKLDEKEKRTLIYLYKPDLESRLYRIKNYITAKEAAAILGLTKLQFSLLTSKNVFKIAISPEKGGNSKWKFSRDEICTYLTRFTQNLVLASGELWSFSEILKYFGGKIDDPLTTLLNAIDNQELKPVSSNKNKAGLASLMFCRDEFLLWYELHKVNEKLLAVPSAAKLLGVNQEFMYQLINQGYLQTTQMEGSQTRWITQENLQYFKDKYVLLSKLAKFMNLNSRVLKTYLLTRAIYPVDYNMNCQLRQKLYMKDSLRNVQIIKEFI